MNQEMYTGFESYLSNEMPADERKQFEEQLRNDADFRRQFDLYKETIQFLDVKFSSETAAFRQNLKTISGGHFPGKEAKETRITSLKPWYYAVAASVAVVSGLLFFNQDSAQYSDYSQHERAVFTERSATDRNLKQAQDFFNAGDYQKAVASFGKAQDLTNPELEYYYAIALIETNNYAKAARLLNTLRNGTSVYKDKATWYLALSKLKQNQPQASKKLLLQIPADAEDYSKAQELLDELD